MTVKEFALHNGYKILSCVDRAEELEITGVYICDLLSMAMAKIDDGELWITVHTNLNIIAIASLTNASCIVIPEGIEVEENTINKAQEKEVVIVQASDRSYDICINFYRQKSGVTYD
ncbi:MAG: hypothetical protein GX283_01515 [Clostridiaceae bacterium]|nr:hypothetical protein [Clostridiaceae bacterium]